MPHVLLMSVAGSLVRKAKLSVILRFAFIMAFLLSLNVCPRSRNEQADYLKRIVDFDDWSVSPHIFRFLDLKWGPHSIDRFADEHNHLLPRFDSRLWNPYCEATDTFTGSSTSTSAGFVRHLPCSADSEVHEVLLHTRYFDSSALAFCSILAFTYNGRFSSGSFC